jgi:hypothetical protein
MSHKIRLNDEGRIVVAQQKEAFRRKFGRDPGRTI